MNIIGIRKEDKYAMERRVPLTPKHIRKLKQHHGIDFIIQSSEKRIFKDDEFEKAGAEIRDELLQADVIFGIKEIPVSAIMGKKTYIMFSHTIKGQHYNMPMLKKMMQSGCTLIDYERIIDELGRRLIFFGKFAGIAGMIDSLWALGLRLNHYGIETPFLKIKQSYKYSSLEEAKKEISEVGYEIIQKGLALNISPIVIGFTGYGNVSNGAQEICGLLPVKEISASELLSKYPSKSPANIIYKVVFKEKDIVKHIDDGKEFELEEYFKNPALYKSDFEKYANKLTVLINGIYWDERYPRLITKNFLHKLYSNSKPKLTLIGDITCDIEGSIESTIQSTHIENPLFVYDPFNHKITMGIEGEGLLTLAVDILPAELPRDASEFFGDLLFRYIDPIAKADFKGEYNDIILPQCIKKAIILHKGILTDDYKYISKYI